MADFETLMEILFSRVFHQVAAWTGLLAGALWLAFGHRFANVFFRSAAAATVGGLVGLWLSIKLGRHEFWLRYLCVGTAASASLAILVPRAALMAATSAWGSIMCVVGYAALANLNHLPTLSVPASELAIVGLALIGVAIQYLLRANEAESSAPQQGLPFKEPALELRSLELDPAEDRAVRC